MLETCWVEFVGGTVAGLQRQCGPAALQPCAVSASLRLGKASVLRIVHVRGVGGEGGRAVGVLVPVVLGICSLRQAVGLSRGGDWRHLWESSWHEA